MDGALKKFHIRLIDMLEDLAHSFPTVHEFKNAIIGTQALILLPGDPERVQRIFNEHVAVPFEERILARDERFLLAHDGYGVAGGGSGGDVVSLIKQIWKDATRNDRDAIWNHFRGLLILNRQCLLAAKTV